MMAEATAATMESAAAMMEALTATESTQAAPEAKRVEAKLTTAAGSVTATAVAAITIAISTSAAVAVDVPTAVQAAVEKVSASVAHGARHRIRIPSLSERACAAPEAAPTVVGGEVRTAMGGAGEWGASTAVTFSGVPGTLLESLRSARTGAESEDESTGPEDTAPEDTAAVEGGATIASGYERDLAPRISRPSSTYPSTMAAASSAGMEVSISWSSACDN